jgi:hypothetical protein
MNDLFELTLKDDTDEVFAISFVAEPAIERDFVYMNKAEVKFTAVDEEQHLVAGPLLIPDKKILRLDEQNNPYWVYFTANTIKDIAQKYLQKKYTDNVTYEHAQPVRDVALVESWVVAHPTKDKSNVFNFTMPKGTWFGIMKVNNPKLWEDVKAGKVKGFSIEGMFDHEQVRQSLAVDLDKAIVDLSEAEASAVLAKIKHILKNDARYRKGQRIDRVNMEGEGGQPSVVSSYPGQFGPGKKKKAKEAYIHPALIGTKK